MTQAAGTYDDKLSFAHVRSALHAATASGDVGAVTAMLDRARAGGTPPWSIGEHAELGNVLMQLKLFDAAEWAFGAIRAGWPQDAVGWRGGALVAAHLADWERCAWLWEESLARCPADSHQPWWLASHADALLRAGQAERAADIHAALRSRWPQDPAGWRGGAQLAVQKGDWSAASSFWRESLALTPEANQPPWCWASLADALMKQEDFDGAAAAYATLRTRWPDVSLGWSGSALLAAKQERLPEAAEFWERCLGQGPAEGHSSWWWASYADVLQRLDRPDRARNVYAQLRARWPNDPAGWRGGVRLIAEARGWRGAVRRLAGWREAVRRSKSADLHAEYILALLRAGEAADADRETVAFCSAFGHDKRIITLLTETARLDGDPRRALDRLLRLDEAVPFGHCPPSQLVLLLYNAGKTRSEAARILTTWLGSDDHASYLDPLYGVLRAESSDLAELAEMHRKRKRPFATRADVRRLLALFLKDRSYPCFEAFVASALEIADERGVRKLHELAEARFPRSRLALQLGAYVTAGSVPLSAEDNAFAYRWRNMLPDEDLSIAPQLAGRPWRRLVCALMIRDEDEMLPHVLRHYSALGVDSFIIIDNGSETDPATLLSDFGAMEITLVRAASDFAAVRHGTFWLNEILGSGCCDWLLFVDCDEFLVFPGDADRTLPQLLDHFDARGETAMFALMLDAFDQGFASGRAMSGKLEDYQQTLASIRFEPSLLPPWIMASGGVRDIQQHLVKTPLVKAAAGLRYLNNHYVTQCRRAATRGALIHHKIFRDREFFVSDLEAVFAHSRVKHRNKPCVSRHLAMAQLRMVPGPEQAFHVGITPDRLSSLGYVSADPAWEAQLPRRPASDRMAAAGPAQRRLATMMRKPGWATLDDMPLPEMLKQLAFAAGFAPRQDLRLLLNAHMARIGPGEVRCAMLLFVAQHLHKRRVSQRLLRRLLGLLDQAPNSDCAHALADIAAAMGPGDSTAVTILEALMASADPPRVAIKLLADFRIRRGHYKEARDLFRRNDPMADSESLVLYLRSLEYLRDWDRHRATMLAAFERGAIPPGRRSLWSIHVIPSEQCRQEMLARFHHAMSQQREQLDGEGLAAFLAASHLLGRKEEFAATFRRAEAQLPSICQKYFNRLIKAGEGMAPPNRAWCVGLSKTGTTSFHVFCNDIGLASAHWMNPVLGNLITPEDGDLFDVVSDSTVTYLARVQGIPKDRKVVATTRDVASWSRSFMQHFRLALASPGASFEKMREIANDWENLGRGKAWHDIHHELHFRFRTLVESYDFHHEWLAGLRRERGDLFLEVPVEESAEAKAQAVRRFLGETERRAAYPHANLSINQVA